MKFLIGLAVGAAAAVLGTKALGDPQVQTALGDLREQIRAVTDQLATQAADAARTAKDTAQG